MTGPTGPALVCSDQGLGPCCTLLPKGLARQGAPLLLAIFNIFVYTSRSYIKHIGHTGDIQYIISIADISE